MCLVTDIVGYINFSVIYGSFRVDVFTFSTEMRRAEKEFDELHMAFQSS
jgi:hypothetical protein